MTRLKLAIAAFACLVSLSLNAQSSPQKWGKISDSDLKLQVYGPDSAATAVVLQDVGSIRVEALGGKFTTLYTKHRRMKIFDVSALDQGNLFIPYYSYGKIEKLAKVDVQVIKPDGAVVKVKSDNFYDEQYSKRVSVKKIFIPNLEKGDILEYRYELRSEDIVSLNPWFFQDDIPVRYSVLDVYFPENLTYVYLIQTNKSFDARDSERQKGGNNDGTNMYVDHAHFIMSDLPAIREEPYTTTVLDYRSYIRFQLQSVKYASGREEAVMSTWNKLATDMEEATGFGLQYKHNTNFNQTWSAFKPLIEQQPNPDSIMQAALRFVSNNIKWDENYRVYIDKNIDNAFQRKSGSSAEINLALVALLQKAGLNAYPAILSTREHGAMFPAYPFVEQFNSVIVAVKRDDHYVYLDATSPYNQVGELQTEYYNSIAWVVSSKNPEWVEITSPEYAETWYGQMKLSADGTMSGHFILNASGRGASSWREDLNSSSPEKFLMGHFAENYPEKSIDSISVSGSDPFDPQLKFEFNCTVSNTATELNDFLYFKPVLGFWVEKNPFVSMKRLYPVSFPYPTRMQYVLTLELPEGYVLDELPKPAKILLPDNKSRISYSCIMSTDGNLQVTMKANLSQSIFEPDEYEILRQYFDLMVEKVETQLVLKKA